MVVGTTLAEWISLSISNNRGSGTFIVPRFDFEDVNAALWTSALVFEIQLNKVVLPVPAKPMIPQRNGIVCFLHCKDRNSSDESPVPVHYIPHNCLKSFGN